MSDIDIKLEKGYYNKMGIASSIASLAIKTPFKMAKTAVSGGIGGRIALGAGVGGVVGAFRNDYNKGSTRAGDILSGMTGGAMMGAGAWGASKLLPKAPGALWKTGIAGAKALPGISKTAFKAGRFAMEHPLITAGAVGGVWGASSYMDRQYASPTISGADVNVDYNQQAMATQELTQGQISPMGNIGPAPTMMGPMHRAMQQSTEGVVQGLWQGRHS